MKRFTGALIVMFVFCNSVAAGPFEDAVAAYEAGNYASAYQLWRQVAEQGDPGAQLNLGFMYSRGQGVPQNYAEAFKWYRLAAEQGDANGQAMLGAMYANGEGTRQDYVMAHMWLNLAAEQGDADASEYRDSVANVMSPEQIAEAQRLAREWKPKAE